VQFDKKAVFAGSTRSSVINCAGFAVRGLYIPAGFVGTAVTFLCANQEVSSNVDAKLLPVTDEVGTVVSITVAASRYVVVGQEVGMKLNAMGSYIVVVSNASETLTVPLVVVASAK
jgi:hypothetical protein